MGIVRPLAQADLARCRAITFACLDTIGGVNEAMREVLRGRVRSDRFVTYLQQIYTVVYEEDGQVFGLGGLTEHEIKRMYTDPAAQGKGVGTAIIRALEAEARRRGLTELVAEAYTSAEGFYLKVGFHRVRPDVVVEGEARQDFIHMAKTLQ